MTSLSPPCAAASNGAFKAEPQNTLGLGPFLCRAEAIRDEPKAPSDCFFEDLRIPGAA